MTVNWQEQYKTLKLAFPINVGDPRACFEVPYGCAYRQPTGEEEPAQQWVDVTGQSDAGVTYGVALLNESKYGFDVKDSEIRMTVLRSPAYAHHDPAKLDPAKRYPHIDQGEQHLTWRLVPHKGIWQDASAPQKAYEPVSYTHLTLPTILRV